MVKVLVVDDDRDLRFLIASAFQAEGHTVAEADDGEAALAMVESTRPDAVILDLMMAGSHGWDLLRSIRRDPDNAGLPVIVCTALSDGRTESNGWSLGCDAFISKPFKPDQLVEELEDVVARPAAARLEIRKERSTMSLDRAHVEDRRGPLKRMLKKFWL